MQNEANFPWPRAGHQGLGPTADAQDNGSRLEIAATASRRESVAGQRPVKPEEATGGVRKVQNEANWKFTITYL
jgi:hypothetical protein